MEEIIQCVYTLMNPRPCTKQYTIIVCNKRRKHKREEGILEGLDAVFKLGLFFVDVILILYIICINAVSVLTIIDCGIRTNDCRITVE